MSAVPKSGSFDPSKAYKHWEVDGKFLGDGRETALLNYIYTHPDIEQFRGSPEKILLAIDEFARSTTGLINIGETKGSIVTSVIQQHKPKIMVECGGYIGFSAIMFGQALKLAGGQQYYSIEKEPLFAAVASSLIDLAGLRNTVRVIVGTGAEGIQRLLADGMLPRNQPLGMAFFDHHKPSYTADLMLCERAGLIGKGTVLVADNMIVPGNPKYAAYVRASVEEKKARATREAERGNPDLVYSSQSVLSYEPSGMEDALEITECMGIH